MENFGEEEKKYRFTINTTVAENEQIVSMRFNQDQSLFAVSS